MDQSARSGPPQNEVRPAPQMADKFIVDLVERHQQAVERHLLPFYSKVHLAYVGKTAMDEAGGIKTALLDQGTNDEDEGYLQEPILYQLMDTLTATITPPTPAVEILPQTNAVTQSSAQTAQHLVNNAFRRRRLTVDVGRMVTLTGLFGTSYIKTTWQVNEKLPRFDVIHPKDLFVDPLAKKWEDIRYVIHHTVIPAEVVRLRVESGEYSAEAAEKILKGASPNTRASIDPIGRVYTADTGSITVRASALTISDDATQHEQSLEDVCDVYEVFDFVHEQLIHVAGNQRSGARVVVARTDLPYRLVQNPFSMLRFTDSLDSLRGVSIAQLVTPLIEQRHRMTTMRLRHAASMIPRTLMRADVVKDPEKVQSDILEAATPGHIIPVTMQGSGVQHVPLEALFWSTPAPPLPPDYDKALNDLEEAIYATAGISPHMRGQVGESRVATELALADASNQTRQGRIFQAVGFLIEDLARKVLDLYAEFLADQGMYLRIDGRIKEFGPDELPFTPGISTIGSLDVSVTPYSPQEQTRAVLAQKVMTFIPLLQGMNPQSLDTQRIQEYLLSVAGLPHDLVKTLEAQAEEAEAMAQAAEQEAAVKGASSAGLPIPPGTVTKGGDTQATQAAGSPRAQGAMIGGAGKR